MHYICAFYCFIFKLQMQNMHKTTHDRQLTGVHWPINRAFIALLMLSELGTRHEHKKMVSKVVYAILT